MFKMFIYRLKRLYHFFTTALLEAIPAMFKYGFPQKQLKIIAITGTDGKTTSSTLTYHILKSAGYKVALVSTVACYLGEDKIDTGLHVTAPSPRQLYAFLDLMRQKNYEYLVLETTSHGLYQFRTFGLRPMIAGLTNITHEHTDYHLNYLEYLKAKLLLFKKSPLCILNADDQSFSKIKKLLTKGQRILTYSSTDELSNQLAKAIKTRFRENYNQMNARLASKIALELKVSETAISEAIISFPGVEGRMEILKTKQDFTVVVDFAHTPNALELALTALRNKMKQEKYTGRLIAVFGCAGLRDREKRPMMGKIATDLADLAVFTAEDPRTEDVWSIIRQMKEQLVDNHSKVISFGSRREALEYSLKSLAKKGDVVGIFGKGPEKSMCIGKTEYPWSDKNIALEILES